MKRRTEIIIRYIGIGFGLGFMGTCLRIITANPVPLGPELTGLILGGVFGTTLVAAIIGYFMTRSVPEDQLAERSFGPVRLAIIFLPMVMIAGIAIFLGTLTPNRANIPQTGANITGQPATKP
jgi:nitrate reductase gamma subunit